MRKKRATPHSKKKLTIKRDHIKDSELKVLPSKFQVDDVFFIQLLNSLEDYAVFTTDRNGIISSWNDGAQKMVGYRDKEIIGKHASILFTPEDNRLKMPEKELLSAVKTGRGLDERWHVRKDKTRFWVSGIVFPLKDASGDIYGFVKVMRDLTEKKKAIQMLRESEERYRAFIVNSNEGIWRFELDKPLDTTFSVKKQIEHMYRYAYLAECNDSLAKMYGFTKAGDITGARLGDMLIRDDKQNIEYLSSFIKSGYRLHDVESHERDKEGKEKFFRNSLIGIVENRLLIRTWGTQYDTTEHKKTQESLSLLAGIVEHSEDAILTRTLDGIFTSWNKSAEKMYGFTEAEIIGKPITKLIPKDRYHEADDIVKKIKKGQRISHLEQLRQRKDGSEVYISLSVSPIKDSANTITGIATIARDITALKQFEEKLRESEELYRLVVENSYDLITLVDLKGNIIYASPSYKRILGYTNKDLHKRNAFELLHPDDRPKARQELDRIVKGDLGMAIVRFRHKNGRYVITEAAGKKIESSAKDIPYIVTTAHDITERVRLQEQKDEFIGIASHELKTPVTSIKAYTQVLENRFAKKGDETSVVLLAKMNTQIDKLSNLIGDLLDVTKIEAGKIEFTRQYFDFNELIEEIVEEMQRTTDSHTIKVKLKNTKTLYGDRDRIGQVIMNLISNAIKYSPKADSIILTTKSGTGSISLCVQDFGVGIPKDKHEKIFERFFRVSGPKQNTFPGMGLGLYISSEIIKRQGGKISVESHEGRGSTFCFSFPLKRKPIKKSTAEHTGRI